MIGVNSGDGYYEPDGETLDEPELGGVPQRVVYTRDAMGRVTAYSEYSNYNPASPDANLAYRRTASYDAGGKVTSDTVTSVRPDGTFVSASTYYYNAALASGVWTGVTSGGSYMGGAVTRIDTVVSKNGSNSAAPDTSTLNSYEWAEGARITRARFDSDTGSGSNALWDTDYYRDGAGNLTSAHIGDGRPRWVYLVNDAEGRVLQRDEADGVTSGSASGDPRQLHYYMGGRRVGDISNNGTSNTDYGASIAAHQETPGTGAFQSGAATGTSYADFDQSYDAINGLTYDSTATSYTAQADDTLTGIAQQLWGDASLWYLIAEANGLSGAETIAAGRLLTIPNKIHNSHHSTDTFRPYDPNEAQGDLSPTAPKKPKGNKCGVFGQILQTIVAVAVTLILTPTIGPVGAAIVGNVVSQGFGIITGIQQGGFNFKSLAITAITAGLTQGAGNLVDVGSKFANAAITAALVNTATQGIAIATGLQKKFDFAGVATAGIGSGIAAQINLPGFGGRLAGSMAGGIANAAARSLINGNSFGDNLIAALPDIIGTTIGNEIGGGVSSAFAGKGTPSADAVAAKMQGLSAKVGAASPVLQSQEVFNAVAVPESAIAGYGGGSPRVRKDFTRYIQNDYMTTSDGWSFLRTYVDPIQQKFDRFVEDGNGYNLNFNNAKPGQTLSMITIENVITGDNSKYVRVGTELYSLQSDFAARELGNSGVTVQYGPHNPPHYEHAAAAQAPSDVPADNSFSSLGTEFVHGIVDGLNGAATILRHSYNSTIGRTYLPDQIVQRSDRAWQRGAQNASLLNAVTPFAQVWDDVTLRDDLRSAARLGGNFAVGGVMAKPLTAAGSLGIRGIRQMAQARAGAKALAESAGTAESSGLRFAGSRGVRNAEALSGAEQSQILKHVDELGLSKSDFRISSHVSAYSDTFDVVLIGPNAFPAPLAARLGGTVFERMTPRAVIAHEAGHMITTRAGTSFAPGSVADEIGASLTGRQLPGLSKVEKYQLLRDAAERAANHGTTVRNVLKGY